jgi:hypothetical protein
VASLRRNMHLLSFALDFCTQVCEGCCCCLLLPWLCEHVVLTASPSPPYPGVSALPPRRLIWPCADPAAAVKARLFKASGQVHRGAAVPARAGHPLCRVW